MKRFIKIISLLLVLAAVSACALIPAGAETVQKGRFGIVSVSGAQTFKETNTDGPVAGTLGSGDEVIIAETVKADGKVWYRIESGSGYVFILSQNVELVEEVGMVTAGSVNIRQAPDASSSRIGGATRGKALNIINTVTVNGKTWYKIYFGGVTGYVDSAYVGIMSLPSTETVKADYNKRLYLKAKALNLPSDYEFEFLGITAGAGPDGAAELVIEDFAGSFKESELVYLTIRDENGIIKSEMPVLIEVDSGIFSVILAYLGFIFNGFEWPLQVVEL